MIFESDGRPEDAAVGGSSGPETVPAPRVAEFGRTNDGAAASPARPGGPPQPPDSFDQPVLRNPYVLAGIAVAGAILLAIIVVFVFGSTGGGASSVDKGDGTDVAGALT